VAYIGGADLILTYGTAAIVTFDGILALTADSVAVASPAGTETSATFVNSTVQVTADDAPAAGDSPVSIYVVYTVIGL
jgi:lipopolysaccharide export system protein LptC